MALIPSIVCTQRVCHRGPLIVLSSNLLCKMSYNRGARNETCRSARDIIRVVLPFQRRLHGLPFQLHRCVPKPPSSKSCQNQNEDLNCTTLFVITLISPSQSPLYINSKTATLQYYLYQLFPFSRCILCPSYLTRLTSLDITKPLGLPLLHTISTRSKRAPNVSALITLPYALTDHIIP